MTSRTLIIAEAGVNHDGSLDRALQLVDIAADAGADAVKFQTFKAANLVSRAAPKAEYQVRNTGNAESQHDMIRRLELDEAAHRAIIERCQARGIEFMSTPFDLESLDLLVDHFNMGRVKMPSGDITNGPLLHAAARKGRPIILSTGMSTLDDVATALAILAHGFARPSEKPTLEACSAAYESEAGRAALREKVCLLHCTTEYPAPLEDVHLRAMGTLAERFQLEVGYSDHTRGIAIPVAAVALGATVIEKHFTFDRSLPGPDHKASLEPGELKDMVASIRAVETSLGRPEKQPTPSEAKNIPVARKSLVAARAIRKGERFSQENLGIKRPGDGVSPTRYWEWLGKTAGRDYAPDEKIDP
jgi:N-acetylneuraminate synthase